MNFKELLMMGTYEEDLQKASQNNPQGKLVRVSSGTVLDVAVDLRPESDTFGKSSSIV